MDGTGDDRISRLRGQYDERLAGQDTTHPGYRSAFEDFAQLLLANGGDLVVPPAEPDVLIGPIREMGSVRSQESLSVRTMEGSDCHRNAAALWRAREVPSIGTGYAMSEDRLWREHSWGVTSNGAIVETTVPRATYFGFVFEGDDAAWFADWIIGDENA